MKPDPLAGLAGDVDTPFIGSLIGEFEPDIFFCGNRFCAYLNSFDYVDVATYTTSKSKYGCPLKNLRRLIYGVKQVKTNAKPKEKKFVLNNHSKIFLAYSDGRLKEVYIGSQNLTYGTNFNLMYRVQPKHRQVFVDLFNQMWR